MRRFRRVVLAWAASVGLLGLAAAAAGCAPHIGDHCAVNSDCSLQGNLQCDTSQPNGYCTLFNCSANSCQNSAVCVAVNANVPGCPYNDYMSPSRTALPMCLEPCGKDSDCRTSDGYICRDPRDPPWNAQILDNNIKQVCLARPEYPVDTGPGSDAAPAVCSAAGPELDASFFSAIDAAAAAPEGGAEGGGESGAGDAGEAGSDGAAPSEAGTADAPSGG